MLIGGEMFTRHVDICVATCDARNEVGTHAYTSFVSCLMMSCVLADVPVLYSSSPLGVFTNPMDIFLICVCFFPRLGVFSSGLLT